MVEFYVRAAGQPPTVRIQFDKYSSRVAGLAAGLHLHDPTRLMGTSLYITGVRVVWHAGRMKRTSQSRTDGAGPPPAFDAVPDCSSCDIILSIAGNAWKHGWTFLWIDWGSRGDKHLKQAHLDDPKLDPDIRASLLSHG